MMNSVTVKIESQDLTVGKLFDDFFSVPDFQREYVWGRQQVEKLLQDIYDEFYDEEDRILKGPEYFLGSIVVCEADDGTFQVIDGQQRITTLYLILCALRDIAADNEISPSKVLAAQIAYAAIDPRSFHEVEKYRVTLQYEDSDGVLEKIATDNTQVDAIAETTASVSNILLAYHNIRVFLCNRFEAEERRLREFHGILTTRVKLIRIKTPTVANALKVFETINDRGVGLNAMDLLKNLLFMKTPSQDYTDLKNRWKTLVDALDSCKEKPLRFLRYYIMSHYKIEYHRGIRQDEIYEWFLGHATTCGIGENPLGFAQRLIECAGAYANFVASKDIRGEHNRYLRNLTLLCGALRQQYILLLAGRKLPQDLFAKLCRAIENLFFCYIITREPSKTFERNFARWSGELRNVHDAQGLDAFVEKYFIQDMRNRADRFDFALRELSQDRIQRYRMRYILAKLTQYIQEKAFGDKGIELHHYITSPVHLEHILPQSPTPDLRAAFDKPGEYDEYVGKLGNLTLLEQPYNIAAANKAYAAKTDYYSESNFLLTKSLVGETQGGGNTSVTRAVKGLMQFDQWDSKAIMRRQEMLTRLARKVWGMPADSREGQNETD